MTEMMQKADRYMPMWNITALPGSGAMRSRTLEGNFMKCIGLSLESSLSCSAHCLPQESREAGKSLLRFRHRSEFLCLLQRHKD